MNARTEIESKIANLLLDIKNIKIARQMHANDRATASKYKDDILKLKIEVKELDDVLSSMPIPLGKVQTAWVKSLRERVNTQTFNSLGYGTPRKYRACCLGELHLCYHRVKKLKMPFEENRIADGVASNVALSLSYDKYGLRDLDGVFKHPVSMIVDGELEHIESLATMNDSGMDWVEIADFIESNTQLVITKSI